jgi:hypothetical protein
MAYECLRASECLYKLFSEKRTTTNLLFLSNLSSIYMSDRALTKTPATKDYKSQSETVSIVAFLSFQIVATVSNHRDKTRVQMPVKMFPHLKLLCFLLMGPTLAFDTKQRNSFLINFFAIKARF